MRCWIFDDQYGKRLYEEMSALYPSFNFPIKDNVSSPIQFINNIKDGDLILLDNFFPGETWEESLGDVFLGVYIDKKLKCKIICISDYGDKLLDKYYNWNYVNKCGDIIGYVPEKDGIKISKLLAGQIRI